MIPEDLAQLIHKRRRGLLVGRVVDEDVYQVWLVYVGGSLNSSATQPTTLKHYAVKLLGAWSSSPEGAAELFKGVGRKRLLRIARQAEQIGLSFLERLHEKPVLVESSGDEVKAWVLSDGGGFEPAEVFLIKLEANLFSRLRGLFDHKLLEDKTVTIIGLGTGGGLCAVELAKAGVGRFKLVDFDRLETGNVTRHVCGLSDVGRLKTSAVRDVMLEKNPQAEVEEYVFDVLSDREKLREVIRGSDLVIVATDSEVSKLLINEVCLEEGVPAVYAAAYERAFGGDVIRVIPGETPCYDCVMGTVVRELGGDLPKGVVDYSSITDPTKVRAQPGLSTDVAFISLIQVKYALATLLRGSGVDAVPDFKYNMVLWGNRPEWLFKRPLQAVFVETKVRKGCETCQRREKYAGLLGMTEKGIEAEAEEILRAVEEEEE